MLRHTVRLTKPDRQNVLTVGNGDFAYTADITGMQSLTSFHDQSSNIQSGITAVNTATMSSWGWHEMPNPAGYALEDAMTERTSRRGPVRYPDKHDMEGAMRGTVSEENAPGAWLNANPQRLDLGRIGFLARGGDGAFTELTVEDLTNTKQTLNSYTGIIDSRFTYQGQEVIVQTTADPHVASVGFSITSPLLADGSLHVVLRFPYAHSGFFQTADWSRPEDHRSELVRTGSSSATIGRQLDDTVYRVEMTFNQGELEEVAPHQFVLRTTSDQLFLSANFQQDHEDQPAEQFATIAQKSADSWAAFWASGAAIDFSGSTDARANELERRVILSQYYFEKVHTELICADLTDDYTGVTGDFSSHFPRPGPPFTREAPAYFERNGTHYLITSGSTGYFPNFSEVSSAPDYHGPWTILGDAHPGDPSRTSFRSQISCIFKHPHKDDLYIAVADRWLRQLPENMPNVYDVVAAMTQSGTNPEQLALSAAEDGTDDASSATTDAGEESATDAPSSSGSSAEVGTDEARATMAAGMGENTAIADYVWLPIRFDGGYPVIAWHDEWRVEDYS
ncbi:glycoside hydrolase family protein [Arthrobacter sp. MDT1-48-3]